LGDLIIGHDRIQCQAVRAQRVQSPIPGRSQDFRIAGNALIQDRREDVQTENARVRRRTSDEENAFLLELDVVHRLVEPALEPRRKPELLRETVEDDSLSKFDRPGDGSNVDLLACA
jgi:hypothetical protein